MLFFGVCALQSEPVVEVHFDVGPPTMSFVELRYCIQVVQVFLLMVYFTSQGFRSLHEVILTVNPFTNLLEEARNLKAPRHVGHH